MTLYEIDKAISECVNEETGEVIDIERLTALQMDRTEKIENVVEWIENLKHDIDGLREQEETFHERRRKAEQKVDRLTEWVANALQGQKFETVKARVLFRKSTVTNIYDEDKIPDEYKDTIVVKKVDLNAVKAAIKAGKDVDGARIETRLNAQINPKRGVKNGYEI